MAVSCDLNLFDRQVRDMNHKNLPSVPFRALFLCLMLILSAVPGCTSENGKKNAPQPSSKALSDPSVLATIADDDMPEKVISAHSATPETQGQTATYRVVFSPSGTAVAYVANRNGKFQVVHNQVRDKEYQSVGGVVFSSDGRRIAYPAVSADAKWRMVVDGKEGKGYDTLLKPVFSPDGRHVAYQAKERDKWYIVVDEMQNQGTIASYTEPEFSADSTMIAYIEAAASNKDMRLFVSDLRFNNLKVTWSIGDLLSKTSRNGTRLAAAQVVGSKQRIIDFHFARPDVVHEGREYDLVDKLTLSDDGKSLVYCVERGKERLIVFDGKEEPLPDGRLRELPVIRPDRKGVGILFVTIDRRFFLHQSFVNRKERGKIYDEAYGLTYANNGAYAYAARKGNNWFVVVNGAEGPAYEQVIAPLFNPDGKRIVYRAKKDGKRFVVVADSRGKTIRQHPAYDEVFDATFSADGNSVAYGVRDGKRLIWKVEPL